MPMLAETIDAVVGGDTHRDSHALEIASPTGTPIATLEIDNDDLGFSQALAWIVTHAPGPNIVVALEGTRSYGIGLARALQAAGLMVIEVARPRREQRRRGKSDPIDAHLAVLHALRMPAATRPCVRRRSGAWRWRCGRPGVTSRPTTTSCGPLWTTSLPV